MKPLIASLLLALSLAACAPETTQAPQETTTQVTMTKPPIATWLDRLADDLAP